MPPIKNCGRGEWGKRCVSCLKKNLVKNQDTRTEKTLRELRGGGGGGGGAGGGIKVVFWWNVKYT